MHTLFSSNLAGRHRLLWITALAAVAFVVLANAMWGVRNVKTLASAYRTIELTHVTTDAIDGLAILLLEAESGQRGYLLSGDGKYLVPYREAIGQLSGRLNELREQFKGEPVQLQRLVQLEDIIRRKNALLAQTLQLVEAGQRDSAIDLVKTNQGLVLMQTARQIIQTMQAWEIGLRSRETENAQNVETLTQLTSMLGALIGIALVFTVAMMLKRDLDLRAQSATYLRTQRDWLQTTLHSIADAVIVADRKGNVVLVNPVAEQLLGEPAGAIVGRPISDTLVLIDEHSRKSICDPVTVALSDGRRVSSRNPALLRSKDGTEYAIEENAALNIDAGGETHGAVMVFRDVSDRRKAELALRNATQALAHRNSTAMANERILETILENAPIGIFMTGPAPDFRIVAMSRVTREWIGEQTDQMPADATYHKLLPDGSIPTPGQLPLYRAMREGIAVRSETWIIQRTSGPPLRALVDVAPVRGDDGEIVGAVHCWMDLSERERLDRALRVTESRLDVLNRSNVIGLILNFQRDGTVVDCNDALLDMLGFTRRDLRKGIFNLLTQTPAEFTKKDERVFRQLDRGDVCLPFEKELVRKDSGRRISVVAGYARVSGGKDEYVGFVLDVTERKELERRLRQRSDELLVADRRKDHFLAMLAHELRNPLGSLRNSVYLLEAHSDVKPAGEVLPAMRRQLDHLVRLVDDLLDVARISQDKITLENEVVDMRHVLQGALEITEPHLKMNNHRLHVADSPTPLPVMGDHTRLVQMVANILHNAAKYTPVCGDIWMSLEPLNGTAVLRVRDNGQGIAADLLPHIFNAFIQADQSLARTSGGLGVGLAVVRKLTELHGGRVEARSGGLGQGSEFELQLPLVDASTTSQIDLRGNTDPATPVSAQRILVVDDNADLAASTAALLELWGHETCIAHCGREALEIIPDFRPQVILLDIGLPGLDGAEIAKIVRSQPENARIRLIAVSGYGQPIDQQRAKEAGFDLYLVKPLRPSILRKTIEESEMQDTA